MTNDDAKIYDSIATILPGSPLALTDEEIPGYRPYCET
jgi:hypothetical protein